MSEQLEWVHIRYMCFAKENMFDQCVLNYPFSTSSWSWSWTLGVWRTNNVSPIIYSLFVAAVVILVLILMAVLISILSMKLILIRISSIICLLKLPEQPRGWPRAIAPPEGLTRSMGIPRYRTQYRHWEAKAWRKGGLVSYWVNK